MLSFSTTNKKGNKMIKKKAVTFSLSIETIEELTERVTNDGSVRNKSDYVENLIKNDNKKRHTIKMYKKEW